MCDVGEAWGDVDKAALTGVKEATGAADAWGEEPFKFERLLAMTLFCAAGMPLDEAPASATGVACRSDWSLASRR